MKLAALLILFVMILMVLVVLVLLASPGFKRPFESKPNNNGQFAPAQANNTTTLPNNQTAISKEMPSNSTSAVRIATWNIQNFGVSKATNASTMQKIAMILRDYDIIAVQEISNIREKSDKGCPRNEGDCPGAKECGMIASALEKYLNVENNQNYRFTFSEQVKDERYLFIWDPDKVMLEESMLMPDPEDSLPICDESPAYTGRMIRQPFYGRFRAGNWTFALLTGHTSPSINAKELEGLDYFYNEAEKEEVDIILLGDLNADCSYLKASDSIALRRPDYVWIVPDDADTTVAPSDCAYDRIIYKTAGSNFSAGKWGIEKNITGEMSDHYLVWVGFHSDS